MSAPRRLPAVGTILLLAAAVTPMTTLAGGRGEAGPAIVVRIELADRTADLRRLHALEIDVDAVLEGWARAYVVEEEITKLRALGFRVTRLALPRVPPEPAGPAPPAGPESIPAAYHTYETLVADLQTVASDHPDITRLMTIGTSVQGRDLIIMLVSREPDVQTVEPEVAYISSMHGDEVVGKELSYHLIDYLTDNYGTDPRVTDLVDGAEIWIMPSMNPDGTALGQRWNANGFDLNRNFPDYYGDPVNTPDGRQPETQAIMAWSAGRSIDLAANMHGGALVVNYPWDNNEAGSSVFSPTPDPDHPVFVSISRTYADNNPPMYANSGGSFDRGVTNGAAWYAVTGGMQDWGYAWNGTFEVTLEVSQVKWPPAIQLPQFWDDNLESMLSYLERAMDGIHGVVTDAETGAPLAATIRVDANPFPTPTDPDIGDYHRIALPGFYAIEVSAPGYATGSVPVDLTGSTAVRQDVALQPLPTDLQPVSTRVEDGPGGDGWLDAGEAADLAVTTTNLGRSAPGVSARLVPTGWLADVSRRDATFPDIPVAGTAESDAPHFQIVPDPALPPGHKLGFALLWEADQGAGTSEPFFLEVGAPVCSSASASDLPQPIVDLGTAVSQIAFAEDVEIAGVRVPVDITHTWIGDLLVRLISPSGTSVLLHNQGGGSADDIVGTYGVDLVPVQPLSTLHGEPAAGTWRLEVSDKQGGDTGTFLAWSVEICGRAPETGTPEMRFRDVTVIPGGVRLRWWPYPGLDSYRVYRATDPSSATAFLDVTGEDGDDTDTGFEDYSAEPVVYYLITGVGPNGEGPKGHFGQ